MDIGRSFAFVFEDPDWIKKVLVGGIIALFGVVLFPLLWIVLGYELEIARRTYRGLDVPMPDWDDIGTYFVRGLLATIGIFIWLLPLFVIIGVPIAAIAVAAGDNAGAPIAISLCLLIPLSLLYIAFLLPMALARYAVSGSFGSMFQLGEILVEVRRAPVALLINALIFIVASVIGQLGFLACFIGVGFTTMYSYMIMGHMLGQVYREATGVSTQPAAAF